MHIARATSSRPVRSLMSPIARIAKSRESSSLFAMAQCVPRAASGNLFRRFRTCQSALRIGDGWPLGKRLVEFRERLVVAGVADLAWRYDDLPRDPSVVSVVAEALRNHVLLVLEGTIRLRAKEAHRTLLVVGSGGGLLHWFG